MTEPTPSILGKRSSLFSAICAHPLSDLMHAPEQGYLVAGAVEPVVAQVYEDGGGHPGEGTVPGQVHLDVDI